MPGRNPDPRIAYRNYWFLLHDDNFWLDNPEVAVIDFIAHQCNIDNFSA